MADFLQSTILPGDNIPKHEHRRMLVVLVIILIVAIVAVLGYLWKASSDSAFPVINSNNKINNTSIDPDVVELQKSIINIPEQEKIDSARDLKRSIVPLTDKQKMDLLKNF